MNTEKIINTLKRVQTRISTPNTWCKHAFAVTNSGHSIEADALNACRWCLIGAIKKETSQHTDAIIVQIALYQELHADMRTLFNFPNAQLHMVNDELGFDAVHDLLDATINRLAKHTPTQLSFDF
jgi:hypothetical protein